MSRLALPDSGVHGTHQPPAALRTLLPLQPACGRGVLDLVRDHWGVENSLYRTLDMQSREDDCRMRKGYAPVVMDILRWTALNRVSTLQRNFSPDVSIEWLHDHIGRQSWSLAFDLL